MRSRVGSVPWLLRHELRLAWRGASGQGFWSDVSLVLFLGGILWVLAHLGAWLLLRGLGTQPVTPVITLIFGGLVWLVVSLMLSQAILLSVTALFDRGDFDLLLSSPLSARTVFVVRSLGVAISCTTLYLALFSPFANMGLVTGHANLLAIYPALLSLGLLVSSLGMLLTLTLVRLLGARRARGAAQVIGALAGATLFLLSQAQNMVGADTRMAFGTLFSRLAATGGPLAPDSMLWFPFHAMLGEPVPLLGVVIAGCGGFWLITTLTQRRFLAGTQASVTGNPKAAPARPRIRFRAALWRNVLVKEWKLIARDPNLIAQTLLQGLYLLPAVFVILRREELFAAAVPGVILLAGALAGSLAWITVAAEEAPELIGTSPVPFSQIRRLKVLAALVPVWVLVSPLLFVLLARSISHALVFVLCLAGVTVSAGVVQIWLPRRGDRKNMRKRAQAGKLASLLEGIGVIGWAGLAYCLMAAPVFTPLALVFALVGPATAWIMGRSKRAHGMPL